jgi:hypothetical protein
VAVVGRLCRHSAALWPEKSKDYWSKLPGSDNPETVLHHQADLYKKYLFVRRMQSFADAKFAHLVRSEAVPSFSQYRERRSSSVEQKKRISMLDDENADPLAEYARYVDYTIGRMFAIIDSGFMGLVPSGAKEGDLVVQIQNDSRIMHLALREEDFPEQTAENTTKSNHAGKHFTKPK